MLDGLLHPGPNERPENVPFDPKLNPHLLANSGGVNSGGVITGGVNSGGVNSGGVNSGGANSGGSDGTVNPTADRGKLHLSNLFNM